MATGIGISVVPHLIPAGTIANSDFDRAMTEPLAAERDEVLYLVCSHPRLRIRAGMAEGEAEVVRAIGSDFGTNICWESRPWAKLELPESVTESRVPWALLDSALETIEKLPPIDFDPDRDPDGTAGQHRQELLPWIFDRHLEAGDLDGVRRGHVHGGKLEFRLDYIGMGTNGALARATKAHHKIPRILAHTLVFEPHRVPYLFPCDIHMAVFDTEGKERSIAMQTLRRTTAERSIPRELLVKTAEQMLIVWLGTEHNVSNTKERRFPNSHVSAELAKHGFELASVNVQGLPPNVTIKGTDDACPDPRSPAWDLVDAV